MNKEYAYQLQMKVRDYECDLQGVVNNANYQHYMEHTRHEYLESLGENFGALHDEGIDLFVSRVEIQYKVSLHSGENFISALNYKRDGVKLVFLQDILRASDMMLCARGKVDCVIVQDGKLTRGEKFDLILNKPKT